jgi:hypothetical protein
MIAEGPLRGSLTRRQHGTCGTERPKVEKTRRRQNPDSPCKPLDFSPYTAWRCVTLKSPQFAHFRCLKRIDCDDPGKNRTEATERR